MTDLKSKIEKNYCVAVSRAAPVQPFTFDVDVFVVLVGAVARPVMPGAVGVGARGVSTTTCWIMGVVILAIDSYKRGKAREKSELLKSTACRFQRTAFPRLPMHNTGKC